MGLFDGAGQGSGLMDMYANPQMAGMLGMAQGLLAASQPSRMPIGMGAAMGQGLGGMMQGYQNSLGMQRQLLQMKAMQGLMGGDGAAAPQAQPSPQQQPTSLLGIPANPSMGILSPTLPQSTPQAQAPATPNAGQGAGPLIFGKTPHQLFQQGMLMNMAGIQGGGEMMKIAVDKDPTLALQMPTDMQRNAAAAYGYGSPEYLTAIRGNVDKEGTTPLRAGAPYIRNGQVYGTPPSAPAGYMNQPGSDGTWSVVPVAGGPEAVRASSSAQAGGQAEYKLEKVWDQSANGGQGGYVNQTVSNVSNAANGNAPAPMRNNNPGALMPGGKMAQYPDMQTGLAALDNNLVSYGRGGVNTIEGVISKWAPPNENNTKAYIADVSQRLGIPANQRIDLANPAVRHALGTAIMLHESGPQGVFGIGGAPTSQTGPMAAEPPLGATTATNASQGAPSEQMRKDYEAMAAAGPQAQQSLEYLDHMLQLAQSKPGYMGMGIGGIPGMTRLSTDAAEYEKARASYISAQGKSLGSSGTDASRATIEESVPEYGKPQDAMIRGLTDQRNQLVLGTLRRSVLAPTYQAGNEKVYTEMANRFDQNVKPSMVPQLNQLLSMPVGPARTQALQQAAKDPQMKVALDLMVQSGQLK